VDQQAKTLLARENGSYEWVDPADYLVSLVRTLHDVVAARSLAAAS
jgi:hypothetical protein